MPAISLVVCVYQERELLQRLLREADGCFDDLIVVHDGPDTASLRSIVETAGGRFFEGARACEQEPHWPFAWGQSRHEWILRLDADEFPGIEMQKWLRQFRQSPETSENISGYTCIWPLWNGKRAVTIQRPVGRFFLFHRNRVRFFGMAEQTPIADGKCEALPLTLHHQPVRKSYGVANVLFRKQAYRWRATIARKLMKKPTDLPCWRWTSPEWPSFWEELRKKPLRTAFRRSLLGTARQAREMWRVEHKFNPSELFGTALHQFMIPVTFFFFRFRYNRKLPEHNE